ncbi:hypothetical protein AAVH_11133 [Aphelenchoides avenae]|nr:hypothetical protein AAVH_11133 [Aphelenchus avenae]
MSKELFSEAFQFFTRVEADDLRTTCRMFNEFAGQLCDGQKTVRFLIKIRSTNGRKTSFEDDEEEDMTRLKGSVRAAFVRNCEINASWLSELLCNLFVEACSETAFFNMLFVNHSDDSIREMESAALQMTLNNELFSEAFQFFSRFEADDVRTTCRMFNEFAGQLCDVFGYKMRPSSLVVAKGSKKDTVSVMIRSMNGREISFEDDEEEVMARLKRVVRVAFVKNCEIKASVVSERLCHLFAKACSETEFFHMLLIKATTDDRSTHTVESAALQD